MKDLRPLEKTFRQAGYPPEALLSNAIKPFMRGQREMCPQMCFQARASFPYEHGHGNPTLLPVWPQPQKEGSIPVWPQPQKAAQALQPPSNSPEYDPASRFHLCSLPSLPSAVCGFAVFCNGHTRDAASPDRRLSRTMKNCSSLAFTRLAGTVPFKLLALRSRVTRDRAAPRLAGMLPVKLFPYPRKVASLVAVWKRSGMEPVSWLPTAQQSTLSA